MFDWNDFNLINGESRKSDEEYAKTLKDKIMTAEEYLSLSEARLWLE